MAALPKRIIKVSAVLCCSASSPGTGSGGVCVTSSLAGAGWVGAGVRCAVPVQRARVQGRLALRTDAAGIASADEERQLTESQETQRLIADSPPGISAIPHDDNLRYFDVLVSGPDSSPFEGASSSRAGIADGCAQAACSSSSCSSRRSTRWRRRKCDSSPRSIIPTSVRALCLSTHADKGRRQARPHLPRHPQGQVVSGAPDSHGAALGAGTTERTQPCTLSTLPVHD